MVFAGTFELFLAISNGTLRYVCSMLVVKDITKFILNELKNIVHLLSDISPIHLLLDVSIKCIEPAVLYHRIIVLIC